MKKLFLKYFGTRLVQIEIGLDNKAITNWLSYGYKHKGFKHYYTLRKKTIGEYMGNGLDQKEYWKQVGRLEELKALSINMKESIKG